mmetsp:Transcript_62368/g.75057  ORF Transcript_62368/g.75057 Transcript_62368/m.75057 type:complete len:112 (-) Transcript_62368:309-644(-)
MSKKKSIFSLTSCVNIYAIDRAESGTLAIGYGITVVGLACTTQSSSKTVNSYQKGSKLINQKKSFPPNTITFESNAQYCNRLGLPSFTRFVITTLQQYEHTSFIKHTNILL